METRRARWYKRRTDLQVKPEFQREKVLKVTACSRSPPKLNCKLLEEGAVKN